jgi:surface polysaccharide O-acyltransferase-like enzyme
MNNYSLRVTSLRGILILLVIYIHIFGHYSDPSNVLKSVFFNAISQGIARSAVPIFFIFSAFFLYRSLSSLKAGDPLARLPRLIRPYLIWNGAALLIYSAISLAIPGEVSALNNIYLWDFFDYIDGILGITRQPIAYPLWFLRDLIILNILSIPLKYLIDRTSVVIPLGLLILWLMTDTPGRIQLSLQSFCFFSLGMYLAKNVKRLERSDFSSPILILIYLALLILDSCLLALGLYDINSYVHKICIIVGILSVWALSYYLLKLRLLASASKHSFLIFCAHEPILTIVCKSLSRIPPELDVFIYLGVPVILYSALYAVFNVLEKFTPRVFLFVGGR